MSVNMNEQIWGLLSKIDIVFGVLGGIGTIWGLILERRMRLKIPKQSVTSGNMNKRQSLTIIAMEVVEAAKEPITTFLTILFIGVLFVLIVSSLKGVNVIRQIFYFTIVVFGAIFIGLFVGASINILAQTRGKPISFAVTTGTILASATALIGLGNEVVYSTTLIAFIGSFIGGVLGLVNDEVKKPPNASEQWQYAKSLVIDQLRENLNSANYYGDERIVIEGFRQEKGQGYLVVRIMEWDRNDYGGKEWYLLERRKVQFVRTGEIIANSLLPINEDYEDTGERYD